MARKPKALTPHIDAQPGDFAKTVLMPGDPLRAKWVAKTFLQNVRQVNSVRGMLGYTGTYKGVPVSVMGSGMGIPSIGIYAYELFKFFGVENIVRIGTAGAYTKDIKLGDVVISKDSFSRSSYAEMIGVPVPENKVLPASKELIEIYVRTAAEHGIKASLVRVHASDAFYSDWPAEELQERNSGSEVTEMEAFGLFAAAIKFDKKAISLLTVGGSKLTGMQLSNKVKQTSLKDMSLLALNGAVVLDRVKASGKHLR